MRQAPTAYTIVKIRLSSRQKGLLRVSFVSFNIRDCSREPFCNLLGIINILSTTGVFVNDLRLLSNWIIVTESHKEKLSLTCLKGV